MCLDEPVRFLGDDRRRQNDGERETEFLQFLFRQAEKQSGGNGRAGTREAAKRQANSLHDADPEGMLRLDFRMARRFFFAQPGVNNQHADGRQRAGDQRQVGKQIFNFRVRRAAHENFFDENFQSVTDDAGAEGRDDDLDGKPLESVRREAK